MLRCCSRRSGIVRAGHRLADVHDLAPLARFGRLIATDLRDVTSDPAALDSAGFWAVAADFEGRLTCARFGDVRTQPVPEPVPGQWRGPRQERLDLVPGPRRIHRRSPPHPRAHRGRRGLSGQPLPRPVRAAARPGRRRRGRPHRAAGARQPGPVRRDDSAARSRRGDRHRLAGAVSAAQRHRGRVRADQGHRPDRRRSAGEGPRRERDDRGPRPQRPGAGLRHRHGDRPGALCGRGPPRPGPPRLDRPRRTRTEGAAGRTCWRPPSRPGRSPGRPSPAR